MESWHHWKRCKLLSFPSFNLVILGTVAQTMYIPTWFRYLCLDLHYTCTTWKLNWAHISTALLPCFVSKLPHRIWVLSSMKSRTKFICFTGYCKNFCTSYKFCILGVEGERKCKIQTSRYCQSHMLCTIHRLLFLEDFPSYHCFCSLWQLQSDFRSGALFLEENMAMIKKHW